MLINPQMIYQEQLVEKLQDPKQKVKITLSVES